MSTGLGRGAALVFASLSLAIAVGAFVTGGSELRVWARRSATFALFVTLWAVQLGWGELGLGQPANFFIVLAAAGLANALLASARWDMDRALGAFLVPPVGCLMVGHALAGAPPITMHLSQAWLVLHLLPLVLATAFFGVAGAAGVMLFVQDRLIKAKNFGLLMESLPPLETLDDVCFQHVALGFIFLSFGTLLGFIGVPRVTATFDWLQPKVLCGLAAWVIYAVSLHSRRRSGWRAKRLALLSVTGFLALLVATLVANRLGGSRG